MTREKVVIAIAVGSLGVNLLLALALGSHSAQLDALRDELELISERAPAETPRRAAASSERDAQHEARLLQVEAELGALRRQLDGMERGGGGNGGGAGRPGHNRSVAAAQEVAQALLDEESPELRDKLRDVMREEQSRLRDERDARREERRAEQFQERFEVFAAEVGLNAQQRIALLPRLREERAQLSTLRRAMRDGELASGEAMEQMRMIRAETDAAARQALSAEQQESYEAMREEDQQRGWRGGDGRRERSRDEQGSEAQAR